VKDSVKNRLICGDNLVELATLPTESVDLIYIDPPFFSNRNYEIVWGDEAEIRSFEDRWEGGVYAYIDWMKKRVQILYRILKPTGSFYLHCDWHAGHYLKVMLDDIFGRENFHNEIVWHYFMGGKSRRFFARKHDVIFFYTKGKRWTFNYVEVERRLPKKPSLGSHKPLVHKGDAWYSTVGMDDVWDISGVFNMSKEYQGYNTQKPEELLERIIWASSNPGDLVLDAFCGCGTTLAVAQKYGRRWIGIDISPSAIALIKKRLATIGVDEDSLLITGMPKNLADLRKLKPFEFQYWAINELHGTPSSKKTGDMGIDGFSFLESHPIQVKQSDGVGRNVVDNFLSALKRYYKTPRRQYHGLIIGFSFTKGAFEEVARLKGEGVNIELVLVEDILGRKIRFEQVVQRNRQNGLQIS